MPDDRRHELGHMASAYVRRVLDQHFYDRLMQSSLGQRVYAMGPERKYLLEFVLYAVAAFVVERPGARSGIRTFMDDVLLDAPTEVGKRLWRDAAGPDQNTMRGFVNSMSPSEAEELEAIAVDISTANPKVDWTGIAQSLRRGRREMRAKGKRVRTFGLFG